MPIDIRATILHRLEALGKSRYWLAEKVQDNPSRNAIYSFLRGERDIRSADVGRLLDAMGARIEFPPRSKP